MLKKEMPPKVYMRFFHALPVHFNVDIYIDSVLKAADILYEDFTEYISLLPGLHTIHITRHKNNTLLYSKKFNLYNQKIYTCLIAPQSKEGTGISFYNLEDIMRPIPSNNLLIRFSHFSCRTPSVDICLPHDITLFKNVSFGEMTNYMAVMPGTYTIQIKENKTNTELLTLPNVRLKPCRFYSIYAIGNQSKENPFFIVIPLDGNSYLKV